MSAPDESQVSISNSQPQPEFSSEANAGSNSIRQWSTKLQQAGFAHSAKAYLQPSLDINALRQGSFFWNDDGTFLAVDENPENGDIVEWPDLRLISRHHNTQYISGQYKLMPGRSMYEAVLLPQSREAENRRFPSNYAPSGNRITRIDVHLSTAPRSMWQKDDKLVKEFVPRNDTDYQHAASCLLRFTLDDLTATAAELAGGDKA